MPLASSSLNTGRQRLAGDNGKLQKKGKDRRVWVEKQERK